MGIQINNALPPGCVADFAGGNLPAGWLFCDGTAISRTTYEALFAAISTTYGAGDGSTTFNLPDARGRACFGKDNMGGTAANRITAGGSGINGATLGGAGGGETVTLSTAQMPSHAHQGDLGGAGAVPVTGGSAGYNGSSGLTGGGGAHANIPPALILNKIIKF